MYQIIISTNQLIMFYKFESGEIRHYKLKLCFGLFKISEIQVETSFCNAMNVNLNFALESASEFFMNLIFVFSKSMNLNLNFVFSKSMNLNFVSKPMNLNLNIKN